MIKTDSNQFEVNLNNYSGPLDVLLDLAKSQKVNLESISVTKLADQFHEFITKVKNLNLELASDYLLMAAGLTYLKSKLLLPESDEEEFKVLEVAKKLKLQLKKLELIRLLSDQLLKKKRIGKDIFFRGQNVDSKSKNDGINENDNSDEESIETKMDSLKSMLDKELITEDEYNEKKKVLLDKL